MIVLNQRSRIYNQLIHWSGIVSKLLCLRAKHIVKRVSFVGRIGLRYSPHAISKVQYSTYEAGSDSSSVKRLELSS